LDTFIVAPIIFRCGNFLLVLGGQIFTRVTDACEPYIKHLKDKIWELRPQRNRILFVTWENDSFVLLHTFVKKTQKTQKEEIEKAQREILDIKKRGLHHE